MSRPSNLIDPLVGQARLYGLMGDLSDNDFDGPVPEPTGSKVRSMAYGWWEKATREGWSIREMYSQYAVGEGFRVLGTASQVADHMQALFEGGMCDGFVVMPVMSPGSIEQFCRAVVPELQRRGLFRRDYAGKTLREHLTT